MDVDVPAVAELVVVGSTTVVENEVVVTHVIDVERGWCCDISTELASRTPKVPHDSRKKGKSLVMVGSACKNCGRW